MFHIHARWLDAKTKVRAGIDRLVGDESGATAIEYGLIAAGIAVAIVAVVFALGEDVQNVFTHVQNQINQ